MMPNIPPIARGYSYHFKHDPKKGIFDHAYEILGVEHDAQLDDDAEYLIPRWVSYRPLYEEAKVAEWKGLCRRTIENFMETVDKPEYRGPRFIPITDPELIAKMLEQKRKMYGE